MRYFGKRGELRIYSGKVTSAAGGAGRYFYQVAFCDMNFSGPLNKPRPDEIVSLDRGMLNSYAHHIQGPDNPIIENVQITFTCSMDDQINKRQLVKALGNPERSQWTFSGFTCGVSTVLSTITWANVNGTTVLFNGYGSLVSTPPPFDPQQDRVNVCVLWNGSVPGTNDEGFQYSEVWFPAGQTRVVESENAVSLNVTGFCYGPVSAISVFPSGVDCSR